MGVTMNAPLLTPGIREVRSEKSQMIHSAEIKAKIKAPLKLA